MVKSKAVTVEGYLSALPPEQAKAVTAVVDHLRKHMPRGYEESAGSLGVTYSIPLSVFPNTYNKQPFMYVAVAAHKNYCSLYLMSAYGYPPHLKALQDAYKKAGKKLDMGKSCIHFRSLDDLELNVIGTIVSSIPPAKWIEIYQATRSR
jgi:hypothetical protein